MRKILFVGLSAGVLACGDGGVELVREGMEDAGELLADAGEVLQDAAQALDSGAAAQDDASAPEPPKGPQVLEAACDQVRMSNNPTGTVATERWARVAVELEHVRSVWACTDKPAAATTQWSGAEIPSAECAPPVYHYAKGAVWALCGPAYQKVRVVAD